MGCGCCINFGGGGGIVLGLGYIRDVIQETVGQAVGTAQNYLDQNEMVQTIKKKTKAMDQTKNMKRTMRAWDLRFKHAFRTSTPLTGKKTNNRKVGPVDDKNNSISDDKTRRDVNKSAVGATG